ncbi:MAG: ribosome-associated translation inhibitor RaiA [Peptostreptococcaceae bacterium]|nr:ribosome-associated translation inhibitor RaiA [Peptostreptococcaceae bacterium]
MRIIVSGKNMDITDALRNMAESKLERIDKLFGSEVDAQVTMSVERNRQIVEITIPLKNGVILRAEEATNDMYISIDKAIDKLHKQLEKHKTRIERRYRGHESIRLENIPDVEDTDQNEFRIVRTKRFPVKPMDPEEAVLQMELLGHAFFVFANSESDEVNVVYKRNDGNYGLIEPTIY